MTKRMTNVQIYDLYMRNMFVGDQFYLYIRYMVGNQIIVMGLSWNQYDILLTLLYPSCYTVLYSCEAVLCLQWGSHYW